MRLPENDEHLVIQQYPAVLDHMLQALQSGSEVWSRKLSAYLGVLRKWAPTDQVQGILNKEDLVEISGIEGLAFVVRQLRTFRA